MSSPVYQRETTEYVLVVVTNNGTPVTSQVSLAYVVDGNRPVSFTTPDVTTATQVGLLIASYGPGKYRAFAKIAGFSPELPVVDCGTFYIN